MRVLVQKLNTNPNYARIVEWGKLISITGTTQIIVQALGFISGILVVRLLSVNEYALYTLANTMLGTMTVLADSGISNGVMAQGGKVWQDKKKLGSVLVTGLTLRKKFGIISLLVATPVMVYLLLQHGASLLMTALIIVAITPAFFASISDSFLEMTPKLHQDIKPLQRNQLEVGLGRALLNFLFLSLFPLTFVALIANSIPRIYGNYRLRKLAARFADVNQVPDAAVRKEVIKGVNRTLPVVIYYCLSSQISIWLISFLGTTNSISEIGALGRIGMVFNLFATLFATLAVPRFSRMENNQSQLLRSFFWIQILVFVLCIFLSLCIWLFSNQLLWLLGSNYTGLNYELFLVAIANCLILLVGVCSQLVLSRGWFINPYLLIGTNFLLTVISLLYFNMSSLVEVLYFNIVIVLVHYLLVFFYGLKKIKDRLI
jgi:O-antigen/teichoic acid export membrane protein